MAYWPEAEAPMAPGTTPKGAKTPQASALAARKVHGKLKEAGEAGLTRKELLDKLALSARTLDRALSDLEGDGGRLRRESAGVLGKRTYRYVLDKDPKWATGISHYGRLALQVAEMVLDNAGTEIWSHYFPVLERLLTDLLSDKDLALFEALRGQLSVRGAVARTRKRDADVLLKLLDALAPVPVKPELELLYRRAGEAEASWVRAVPFCLTHDALAGSAYLLAWDVERAEARHFRFGRIEQVKNTRRSRSLPEPARAALQCARKYQIGGWFKGGEPFPVEVEVTGEGWVKAFLDAEPALPEVEVTDRSGPGGAQAIVRVLATELVGPTRWVLQLGPDAKVLAPEALRANVADKLKRASAHYGHKK